MLAAALSGPPMVSIPLLQDNSFKITLGAKNNSVVSAKTAKPPDPLASIKTIRNIVPKINGYTLKTDQLDLMLQVKIYS